MNIFWVGISCQRDASGTAVPPLSEKTPSGRIIDEIIRRCPAATHTKINVIDRVLVNAAGKLRNPTHEELAPALCSTLKRMEEDKEALFVFLGSLIRSQLERRPPRCKLEEYRLYDLGQARAIFIQHPSYVRVYRYKQLGEYQSRVAELIHCVSH
jgi:hypothetical protein